jgi:hypothetical protein
VRRLAALQIETETPMSLPRVARTAALLSVGLTLATSASALGATTTLGPSDLSPIGAFDPGDAPFDLTYTNLLGTTATQSGTITTWRFVSPRGGHAQLAIVAPSATPGDYTTVAVSPMQMLSAGLNTFSTSLPIAAGQLAAVAVASGTSFWETLDASASVVARLGLPTVGATDSYTVAPGGFTLFNADEDYVATYAPPNPVVGSLSAASGSTAGGETLTISGENFSSGSTVAFGDVPATSVTVDRFNQLTVVVPPHAEGAVDVRVTNSSGTSAVVNADAYTFVAPPAPPVSDAPPAVASAPSQTVAPKMPA